MNAARWLEGGAYATTGFLVVATMAYMLLDSRQNHARQMADAGLEKLAAAERTLFTARKQFAPFGPNPADLAVALPGVSMPETAEFSFDALPDPKGTLHLRAVSRPDAVAAGRVFPVLVTRELTGGPAPHDAPGDGR